MSNYIEKGKEFLKENNFTQAIEFFQAAIDENSRCEEAYVGLSSVFQAMGKEDDAQKALFQCLAINPNNTEALTLLSKQFSSQHQTSNNFIHSVPVSPSTNQSQSAKNKTDNDINQKEHNEGCWMGILGAFFTIGGLIGVALLENIWEIFAFLISIGLIMVCVGFTELDK